MVDNLQKEPDPFFEKGLFAGVIFIQCLKSVVYSVVDRKHYS